MADFEDWRPHAFHLNLPSHHKDPKDGIPWVTKVSHRRSRTIVKLVHEIQLTEQLFYDNESVDSEDDPTRADDNDDDNADLEFSPNEEKPSIESIIRKCNRIHAQLNTLENMKYSGITQMELCEMLLHVLKLLTATVSIKNTADEDNPEVSTVQSDNSSADNHSPKKRLKEVTLHFDDVGYIHDFSAENEFNGTSNTTENSISQQDVDEEASKLEHSLKHPFALPSPARESLLSIAFLLISKKGRLSSVSNTAIFLGGEVRDRKLLVIHWKALLRMLLRTAPYLDEHKAGMPPTDSASRKNSVIKKTVNFIRQCRRYFDQGLVQTAGKQITDKTSREVWNMVKIDLMYHTHSNSSFRAIIMLYLFQPSFSSSEFYNEVMPQWLESWSSIDRCPDFDSLWLVMFCRGRKFASDFNWELLRTKLLTHCCYWTQIPLGGSSNDKSFPSAAPARSRALSAKLKIFIGDGGQWTGFVGKIAKLLIFCLGRSDEIHVPNFSTKMETQQDTLDEKKCTKQKISSGTADFLQFLSYVTPYFNPSNTGNWTFPLGALLHYLAFDFSHRIGMMAWYSSLSKDEMEKHKELFNTEVYLSSINLPPNEIAAVFDILIPLCQQALYSKNSYVSRAGEAALFFLANADPLHVCPPFLDFLTEALHVSSVNLSHQAPAALSALSRLIQPSLRSNAPILLERLQEILSLSLAGIDSNDENKTMRTLIFYRNIASWIPVGKVDLKQKSISIPNQNDGTINIDSSIYQKNSSICMSDEYFSNIKQLPESSLLRQQNFDENFLLYSESEPSKVKELNEQTVMTMGDWSLAFLDRLYALLRVAGEHEKVGKNTRGIASRHLSVDASQARNFSRVLKECVVQMFSSMDVPTHESASRSVAKFINDETVPLAAKDASAICEAVSSTRLSNIDSKGTYSGLRIVAPILTDNLQKISNKTAIYRIRCLSGAVRRAGIAVLEFREEIISTMTYALADHDDRHLFKAGCKLLRHTLSSQCESYPIASDNRPHFNREFDWGVSAQLHDDGIRWHVPCVEQIEFAVEILEKIVFPKMKQLSADLEQNTEKQSKININEWRRSFRILRYSLRGCNGILLDEYITTDDPEKFEEYDPNEIALWQLIQSTSKKSINIWCNFRRNICSVITNMMSLVAKDSFGTNKNAAMDVETTETRNTSLKMNHELINDPKLCKELSEISCILTTRRSVSFRCQDTRYIWRAQKQILTDYTVAAHIDQLQSINERCNLAISDGIHLYKDGEGGGKTLPRRLVVGRVEIFIHTIQRNSSFAVPRRLRRQRMQSNAYSKATDFTSGATFDKVLQSINHTFDFATYTESPSENDKHLDCYEGIVAGLFAMTCHQNVQVRSAAFGVADYALSRFSWFLRLRAQRLLSSLSLSDENGNGIFGLPSCHLLSKQIDSKETRKRLADALKGICSITAMPRTVHIMMMSEKNRIRLVKALCGSHSVLTFLPTEEMHKIVHYFHTIFSQFRSKFFSLPRTSEMHQKNHESCIIFLIKKFSSKSTSNAVLSKEEQSTVTIRQNADILDNSTTNSVHWRIRLMAGWFILTFVDESDLKLFDNETILLLWKTCFGVIRHETGQPLQRVALGILGRLITLALTAKDYLHLSVDDDSDKKKIQNIECLQAWVKDENSLSDFVTALVFDHKEDSSIGGGHDAQWAAGVEEILKDASANVAPKVLFPFQRTNRLSSTFKLTHAQLVQSLLLLIGRSRALTVSKELLHHASIIAASPPSEDKKNQQCTSAEIFAGVSRALIQSHNNLDELKTIWSQVLLPYLDDVIPKLSSALVGAYFDALRYCIHHQPPNHFFELTKWLVTKVQTNLWQHKKESEIGFEESENVLNSSDSLNGSIDGFASQSKLLLLVSGILIELDAETELGSAKSLPWYTESILNCSIDVGSRQSLDLSLEELGDSWKLVISDLLPCLLNALGHPYEKCREHIAGCLFRICYCHKKIVNKNRSLPDCACKDVSDCEMASRDGEQPGSVIIRKLSSIVSLTEYSFKEKYRALVTARKFIVYCVHLGDCKHEYSDYIIPLLPLCFEAVKSTQSNDEENSNASNRMLEAEVVKGYRYNLAEVSVACTVSYFGTQDISRVLNSIEKVSRHETWQVRQAAAHFLRCFQGCHKFLFTKNQRSITTEIITNLLADDRREVSNAAMSALTGVLSSIPQSEISSLVTKYINVANKSLMKKKKRGNKAVINERPDPLDDKEVLQKERDRAFKQQTSVFFLCASILSQPYNTPSYVPAAIAAISKHSFEKRASLGVRDTVKMCCGEFKRTHMSDNWDVHRKKFSEEQLDALEDVVSTPHYYA